jgi:predicted amidohydrolase
MIKIAGIQMPITSDKETNLKKAEKLLLQAADEGAKLAALPEYFLMDCPESHMTPAEIFAQSEPIPGPSSQFLADIAKKTGMYICSGSYLEQLGDGRLTNSSALINPAGEIMGTYQKVHPENAPPKMEYDLGIVPGERYPVFDTAIGKVGIMLDMDAVIPEAFSILAVKGAEIIIWCVNWSARWFNQIDILPAAHAMLNKIYTLTANRCGTRVTKSGTFHYNGGSKVCTPEGFTIARAIDYAEGIVVGEFNPEIMREWREKIIPRDYPLRRRPETYGEILNVK